MAQAKFRVKQVGRNAWSVVDAATEQVVHYNGVLLVGVSEQLATDMAELLNFEHLRLGTRNIPRK
jgi:hypothetical protein